MSQELRLWHRAESPGRARGGRIACGRATPDRFRTAPADLRPGAGG